MVTGLNLEVSLVPLVLSNVTVPVNVTDFRVVFRIKENKNLIISAKISWLKPDPSKGDYRKLIYENGCENLDVEYGDKRFQSMQESSLTRWRQRVEKLSWT